MGQRPWRVGKKVNEGQTLIYSILDEFYTWRIDLWLPRRSGDVRGMDWKFEISRCELMYVGWINSKILPYSTGNYIQHETTSRN